MKRGLWFFLCAALMLALIAPAEAQWVNGKWIKAGTVKDEAFASAAIAGSKLVENEFAWWFPACVDSGSTAGVLKGSGGWALDGSAPPTVVFSTQGTAFAFDADGGSTGDDIVYLTFPVPANYQTDSLSIKLFWYHLDDDGGATDSVCFDATAQSVAHGEDLFAAGTAMDAVYTMCTASDSALYVTTVNPEVETITIDDLVTIKLWVDESASQLDSGEKAYLLGALVRIRFKD